MDDAAAVDPARRVCGEIAWCHAANAKAQWMSALDLALSASESTTAHRRAALGIEVDVRLHPRLGVPVLRHDPFPPIVPSPRSIVHGADTLAVEEGQEEAVADSSHTTLDEFARRVADLSVDRGLGPPRRVIVKLDVKDAASVPLLPHLNDFRCRKMGVNPPPLLQVWFNADLVGALGHGGTASFPDPMSSLRLATTDRGYAEHLSIGWSGLPPGPLTRAHYDTMRSFVNDAIHSGAMQPSVVRTFTVPIQFSRIRVPLSTESEATCSAEQLVNFLQTDLRLLLPQTPEVSVTFWRGRDEVILPDDCDWIERHFPPGTFVVDLD